MCVNIFSKNSGTNIAIKYVTGAQKLIKSDFSLSRMADSQENHPLFEELVEVIKLLLSI